MDRIEKGISQYEIWFPPEGSLVLCDIQGHPSLIEIDGQQFAFCWSGERSDDDILKDVEIIERSGFPGPYKILRADLSPALAEGAGDKFTLLLDALIANVHTVVSISGITVK